MKMHLKSLVFAVVASAGLSANALPISAIMWSVPATTANNVPTLGNTPGSGAVELGTFTASAIQFSGDINYSLGGF